MKWTDNQVDVVSKAFMGLTVSCARCHDHKFDAISQKDYYSLFGTLYGARPTQRAIDAPAVLTKNKVELSTLKKQIRGSSGMSGLTVRRPPMRHCLNKHAWPLNRSRKNFNSTGGRSDGTLVETLRELVSKGSDFTATRNELQRYWQVEIETRQAFNNEHFDVAGTLWVLITTLRSGPGVGRPEAPSAPGEFSIERRGDLLLGGIYPGGAYTHLLSTKHGGVIQTPRFQIDSDHISLRVLGGDLSFAQLIIENYAVPRGGIYHLRYSPKADQMTWAQWDTTFWKGFTAYSNLQRKKM
ncbi:MAG: hypothetical protein CM1200mP25_2730 [Acidobacteriota bacterium]|nr:MAG: hypothetical protein CM1200mP25_2730 [Acidobacteriota bacterium]